MSFQPTVQIRVATVDRVGHDPGEGDLRFPEALDHL
jgi:hypothetical protein